VAVQTVSRFGRATTQWGRLPGAAHLASHRNSKTVRWTLMYTALDSSGRTKKKLTSHRSARSAQPLPMWSTGWRSSNLPGLRERRHRTHYTVLTQRVSSIFIMVLSLLLFHAILFSCPALSPYFFCCCSFSSFPFLPCVLPLLFLSSQKRHLAASRRRLGCFVCPQPSVRVIYDDPRVFLATTGVDDWVRGRRAALLSWAGFRRPCAAVPCGLHSGRTRWEGPTTAAQSST